MQCSARRAAGGASSCPATPLRPRPSACSQKGRTCSCTRRRSVRTSVPAPPTLPHSTAVQAAEIARDARVHLLALTHLSTAVLRARARPRGTGRVRRHGRAARLRRDRGPVSGAGAATSRQARCAATARRTRLRSARRLRVAPGSTNRRAARPLTLTSSPPIMKSMWIALVLMRSRSSGPTETA